MWNSDDPKSKWLHLVLKLVAALIIFKVGMLVGEFKIIKAMVLRDGGENSKMLFWGDDEGGAGARFFQKRIAPMMGGDRRNMMYWQQGAPATDTAPGQPVPPPQP